jgi:hypothetical protein
MSPTSSTCVATFNSTAGLPPRTTARGQAAGRSCWRAAGKRVGIIGVGECIKVPADGPIVYKSRKKNHRSLRQRDLFENAVRYPPAALPEDFLARMREELTGTLAQVREAAALPWNDLTAATLAELRFDPIAGWLPEDEAAVLRAEFRRELDRLYALTFRRNGRERVCASSPNRSYWAPGLRDRARD